MSASYHAIFHLVLIAAADSVVGWVHRGRLRHGRVYRSIEHRDLKTIREIAVRPVLPSNYQPHAPAGGFGSSIRSFAKAALSLQEVRHTADHDPGRHFHALDASRTIGIARLAQTDWQTAATEEKEALLWLLLFRPRP